MAACLQTGVMSLGALAGAWFGWRCSAKLFAILPADLVTASSPWALVVFLLLLASQCVWHLSAPARLAANYATTTGQVLELYPQNHATVSYTYSVDGKRFERIGSPQNFNKLDKGDVITVYYSPKEPASSILLKPRNLLLINF